MARPRKQSPGKLAVHNRYDAAGTGRRMRGWNPTSTGPNKALVGLQKIRDRSLDANRNDWAGESSTRRWTTSLIGVGITPRLKKTVPKSRRPVLMELWDRWVEAADADGVLNFYGLQTLAVRSWLASGEVFIRRRMRRLDFGMEVPMQIQLIEPEFVPLFDADTWPGMPAGNTIRSGIERDRRGQRVAYWMHREHPTDGLTSLQNLLRIPADEISHLYEPTRPGQLRGVPGLAPVLARLRNIADFDDAVLERQKLANLFVAFITRGSGVLDVDALTGEDTEEKDGVNVLGMSPGIIQELGLGEDVKFANPPESGTGFGEYMRTQHLGTSAGAGLPYELMTGDIKEVSDRTLRVIINEFRRFAEQRQWQVVIPMLCQRARNWWTDAAYLAGHITEDEIDPVRLVEWSPHGWAYIHPVQDPQGKKLEVDAGFRSRSSVIGERGDDPDSTDDERAEDVKREKALDLWVDPNPAPRKAGDDDGIDNDEYSAPPNAHIKALREQLASLQEQVDALEA
jgi:lambda family phage portal protein